MIDTIKTTIDRAGRVVIPRDIRKALRLDEPGEVYVVLCDGYVEIRPATRDYNLVAKGPLVVAEVVEAYGSDRPLTHNEIETVRQGLLETRLANAVKGDFENRT